MYRLVFFNPRLPSQQRFDPGPWRSDPRTLLAWRDYYVREFGYAPSCFRFQVADERGTRYVAESELGDAQHSQAALFEALAEMA